MNKPFASSCMFCNKPLPSESKTTNSPYTISHGICPQCFPAFVKGGGEDFNDFLNTLCAPVFVINPNGFIMDANKKAQKLVSMSFSAIEGKPGGEVFSCRYASLPEGCGNTIHCKTCTIRLTVTRTYETGEPAINVPAYMDLGDITGDRSMKFFISTEKKGDMILLRIDRF